MLGLIYKTDLKRDKNMTAEWLLKVCGFALPEM